MKPDLARPVNFENYNGTDKVCTRAGKPWRSFGEIKSSLFTMAGAVLHPNGSETVSVWNAKGRMDDREESQRDLFYALPEKVEKTFWIGISPCEIKLGFLIGTSIYPSEKDARDRIGTAQDIQIVPITLLVEG